jgi:hypothetical protein
VFERSEYWPRDRPSEIAVGLESTDGNAPSAEDTLKMHGGKGENGQNNAAFAESPNPSPPDFA